MQLVRLAAGIAMICQVSLAQRSPTGGIPTPPRFPSTTNGSLGQPTAGSLNRDIYLSGKVMLDDGTPPPEPATIERVCGGTPRALAYTDKKGQFSFQIGHTSDVMQDASEGGSSSPSSQRPTAATGTAAPSTTAYNVPDSQLANCDLRAVLAGFRSDSVPLGGRRLMDDPDVGTIVLHRLSGVQGTVVSITTLQAPKEARKAYDKGLDAIRHGRPDDAAKLFRKALALDPKFAAAWYELGKLQQQSQEVDVAHRSYEKAIEADAKFMGPYEQLTELALNAENWEELAGTSQRLLELDPVGHPAAYLYNAMSNLKLNRFEAAEASARAGAKADPEHRYPKREQVLAMILAHKQDYAGAAEHLRLYLEYAADAGDAARMRVQLADYERLSGAGQQAKAAAREPGQPDAATTPGNPGPP